MQPSGLLIGLRAVGAWAVALLLFFPLGWLFLTAFKTELLLSRQADPLTPEAKSMIAKSVLATIEQCPDEIVSQQNDTQQPVCARKQLGRKSRATMTCLGQVSQPVAVERHHAGFGNREKRGDDEQDDQKDQQRRKRYLIQARSPLCQVRQKFSIGSTNASVKQAPG